MVAESSGGQVPPRSLALLWEPERTGGRRGQSSLDVRQIVQAALEIADARGLSALSMRRIADQLGVGTMSLYTYVPGKAELIDVMVDTVYGELGYPEQQAADWRSQLVRIAEDNWALYHRHPWLLQVASHRSVPGPNALAKYDYELSVVSGLGLSEAEMDSVLALVLGHVEVTARHSVAMRAAEPDGDRTGKPAALSGLPVQRRYPTASRVAAAAGWMFDSALSPEQAFSFGLERILDGIAVLISSRGRAHR